jgi:two-component system OmpR family response regulator
MAVPSLNRVLLVEDDPDIQAMVAFALEKVGGLRVAACASGPEAIAKAPEFLPEIVLLDVMLPGMDGPATLRALRDLPQTAATPIVFMTARVQPHELEAYRKAGACDILVKPFDPTRLPGLLRAIWRRIHGEAD